MGGIGNVVVNTIVRMFTKKAVGKVMKSAKSVGGAKAKKGKRGGPRRRAPRPARTGRSFGEAAARATRREGGPETAGRPGARRRYGVS